jgi:hypothetical protein
MPEQMNDAHLQIRQILLEDWDPHGVLGRPEAHGEYDRCAGQLYEVIRAGASEEELMDWLHQREKATMCFPSLGKERLRRVARKLRQIQGSTPGSEH